jgi:hypothetical protein
MRKLTLSFLTLALVCLCSTSALATANFVYHEQTSNFAATPTCPSGATNTAAGRYVENTDRSGSAGFQLYSTETYTMHFKIEFQFFTNQARVYYTTDGSNPSGSFGTPFGTTQVAVASYTATYSDQTQSCQVVDVLTATIPPQPTGTTIRYIVGAWHSGGGQEVFANSGTCNGCFNCGDSTTGCATVFQYTVIAPPATPLIISEFRLNGPGPSPTPSATQQQSDEFIEIHNASNADVTVNAFDGSAGFAVAASDGIVRFTIPNGTVIPARGHFLGVNSVGYTLGGYPAGNGTTATGDATYTVQIPTNAGIAIFNTANPANFTPGNRLDAAGATSEANPLYKEGNGYPAITVFPVEYSFFRKNVGGCTGSVSGNCPTPADINNTPGPSIYIQDTGANENDFLFVDTQGTPAGAGQRLGAPGPENISSPILRSQTIVASLIAPCTGSGNAPNRERDTTSDPANNSSFGTLVTRRRFTNKTGSTVTRLRFRIVDISTFPATGGSCSTPGAPGCVAWLIARSSSDTVVANPCGGVNTVRGTTLEVPPAQPNGGAFNSTLSAGTVTLANPLPPTDNPVTPLVENAIDIQMLLGVQQSGKFRFFIIVEALP